MAKTVYFCAGWFSDKQQEAYDKSMEAIKANPTVDVTNSYIPLQHQYKGLRVDEHPRTTKR
jgi:nucleoside deoxyribosyltransferase